MEPYRPSPGNEKRANLIFGGILAGLVLATVVALAVTSCAGDGDAPVEEDAGSSSAVVETRTPATVPLPPAEPDLSIAASTIVAETRPLTETSPAATTPPTLPEKMASIPGGCSQLIVITGSRIGSKGGTLMLFNKDGDRWTQLMRVRAYFGDNGLVDGTKRRTGHRQTPTGIWDIGSFVFGLHARAPSGTKFPYRAIRSTSYWSSEHNSTHNTWVNHRVSGERLADADPQYEYALNTGYNSPPNKIVYGRGTAIFIHCYEPPDNPLGDYTHGCVAIHRKNMIALFRALDPARNPYCAIGTTQKNTATSILAY